MNINQDKLLSKVNLVVQRHGCRATEIGPDTVGIKGDARVYGPCVFVKFGSHLTPEQVKEVSTEITNKVHEIVRVLQEITTLIIKKAKEDATRT